MKKGIVMAVFITVSPEYIRMSNSRLLHCIAPLIEWGSGMVRLCAGETGGEQFVHNIKLYLGQQEVLTIFFFFLSCWVPKIMKQILLL